MYAGIVIALLVGVGGGFYGGMQYAKKSAVSVRGQFANLSPEERAARGLQFGGGGTRGGGRGQGGGAVAGEVITKDAESMTVKLMDGGSKIVFFSTSTGIMRMASGTPADILVGSNVLVVGTTNPGGSVSAQSVQIRPQTRP